MMIGYARPAMIDKKNVIIDQLGVNSNTFRNLDKNHQKYDTNDTNNESGSSTAANSHGKSSSTK